MLLDRPRPYSWPIWPDAGAERYRPTAQESTDDIGIIGVFLSPVGGAQAVRVENGLTTLITESSMTVIMNAERQSAFASLAASARRGRAT